MSEFHYSRLLPCPRADVFAVVADIERYPEFVPGCRAARIVDHDGDDLLVDQELGMAGWSWRFRTRATLEPPRRIRVTTREAPFAYLDQTWRFTEVPGQGTRLALDVEYALRNPALQAFATRLFDEGFRRTLHAFERRLHERAR